MSLCPQLAERAAMPDSEFWERVFCLHEIPDIEDLEFPTVEEVQLDGEPCRSCGSIGACAYDTEGRPLIHAEEDRDD